MHCGPLASRATFRLLSGLPCLLSLAPHTLLRLAFTPLCFLGHSAHNRSLHARVAERLACV